MSKYSLIYNLYTAIMILIIVSSCNSEKYGDDNVYSDNEKEYYSGDYKIIVLGRSNLFESKMSLKDRGIGNPHILIISLTNITSQTLTIKQPMFLDQQIVIKAVHEDGQIQRELTPWGEAMDSRWVLLHPQESFEVDCNLKKTEWDQRSGYWYFVGIVTIPVKNLGLQIVETNTVKHKF